MLISYFWWLLNTRCVYPDLNPVLEFFCFLLQLQLKDLLCNAGFPDGMFLLFFVLFSRPFFLFSIVFWIVLYLSREKKRGNIVLRLPRSGSNTSLELFLRRGEDWGTRRKTLGTSAFVLPNTKADAAFVASHVHCSIICVLFYLFQLLRNLYLWTFMFQLLYK